MINKLTYLVEAVRSFSDPIFRVVIDGQKLRYYLIPAGLDYSSKNEGVIPILNCSCGVVGCGGAYVQVKQEKNTIVWEHIYPEYYEYDKEVIDNDKDVNTPVFELKLDNDKAILLPLIFDKKQYKDLIAKLLKEKEFEKFEKQQYLRDLKAFSKGNLFCP